MLSGTVATWADRAVKDGMEEGRLETWLDRIIDAPSMQAELEDH
jgi:hypothetical protein